MRLSAKYGLNPTIPTCFFCGESKNELILLGASSKAITGQEEAPMHGPVFDRVPCDKCKGYMEQGIIFIETRDGESSDNPYRTGGWWVIKEEAVRRMVQPPELLEQIIKKRVLFIAQTTTKLLGLISGEPK